MPPYLEGLLGVEHSIGQHESSLCIRVVNLDRLPGEQSDDIVGLAEMITLISFVSILASL